MPVTRRRTALALAPVLFALLALAPWPAGAARAQENVRQGDVAVGMDFGWTGFHSAVVEANGSRLAVWADWSLTRALALEADITCLGGNERAPAGAANFTLCTGSLGAALDLRRQGRLVPYLRASVGQSQLDRGAQAGVFAIDARSLAWQAGGGVRLYLGAKRRFALRLDARWLRTGVFDGWATHASVAAGATYRLGKDR
jgi:opacity protein-like surface antigen